MSVYQLKNGDLSINVQDCVVNGELTASNLSFQNIVTQNISASGNATMAGNLTAGPSVLTNITSGNITSSGILSAASENISGLSTVGSLNVLGTASIASNMTALNINTGNITASGNANITGSLSVGSLSIPNVVTGNITASGNATITGSLSVGSLSIPNVNTGNITASGNAAVSGSLHGSSLSISGLSALKNITSENSITINAAPLVSPALGSSSTLIMTANNSTQQYYQWYVNNGSYGGLADKCMQLYSYNSIVPVRQVLMIQPPTLSAAPAITLDADVNIIGNLTAPNFLLNVNPTTILPNIVYWPLPINQSIYTVRTTNSTLCNVTCPNSALYKLGAYSIIRNDASSNSNLRLLGVVAGTNLNPDPIIVPGGSLTVFLKDMGPDGFEYY